MDLQYPYRFVDLLDDENERVQEYFLSNGSCNELVRVFERDSNELITVVNKNFMNHHHLVHGMKVRKDDVWIVTYPKCGTTWTQDVTWNLVHGVKLDRISEPLNERTSFIDMAMVKNVMDVESFFRKVESMPSPRIIKTHYPFELLPPNLLDTCKVIFVSRNIKDVCVSFFYHIRRIKVFDFHSDFPTFASLFQDGLLFRGGLEGYFKMLNSGWKQRNHTNLLIFWYEELLQDPKKIILDTKNHINYDVEEEKLEELCKAMQFESYRNICSMNKAEGETSGRHNDRGEFTRKGINGDWKNHFSKRLLEEWDTIITKNLQEIGKSDLPICSFF